MQGKGGEIAPVRWRFANAEYNERNHELVVEQVAVALEPKPLEVLLCLLRAEGELVTKQELFDTVWAGRVVTDGVLTQAIRRIREVLGDSERAMLRTVHGYGFRLDVPIEIEGRDDPGTRLQLEPGQSLANLPHWILEERIQTRPANELWRIRHESSGELRVVKLALDERAQRALKREVTLNKVLRAELGEDAPLVPLLDWQFDSSPAWVQMPWYEQGSLVDWLEAQGGPATLEMQRRVNIVIEAAEALSKAHALGVMHKDIKPGNLLVDVAKTEPRLLLCDFGSGTVKSRERLDQAGVTVMGFTKTVHADSSTSGTPAYMAPEVLKGSVFSEQSDIYALGILLYQLVIGDLNEAMAADWEAGVSDPGLRAIIAEACAGKPANRTTTMQAFVKRLHEWQAGPMTLIAKPLASKQTRPVSSSFKAAVLMALLAAALWIGLHSENDGFGETQDLVTKSEAEHRVAILAFELLGLDSQTQTVMAGLQDALMADLSNLNGIRLVQGQNLRALGLDSASTEKIGQALNADQLIRGSIQQLDDQLRVNLQLVDVSRGESTWGQVIQATRSDLFAVQTEIATTLAQALGASLSTPTGQAVDSQAYEAYLAALSMWKQGHGKDEEIAENLRNSLSLAPNFIDAHLLSLLKAARDYWFSTTTRSESEARIAEHLSALEAQDTPPVKLATARAVRRYYLEHDPAGGVEILAPFRRHLISNTESALFYAYMLRRIGRSDEAFEILDQVMDHDPSALVPVETRAELLAFQGRGQEAIVWLQNAAERFGDVSRADLKMASFGYQLTGDLRFVEMGYSVLQDDSVYRKMRYHAELELARHRGDLETIRNLARNFDGEDKTISGHGRVPSELGVALALHAGDAAKSEVQEMAQRALEKLIRWRAESDSDARRSTMALALALVGEAQEAIALIGPVEEAYPLSRDQLEAADRLMDASTIYALLGMESEVLRRLERLASSRFVSMNLCAIPHGIEHQAIWKMSQAREFVETHCAARWARNRADMLPLLEDRLKLQAE